MCLQCKRNTSNLISSCASSKYLNNCCLFLYYRRAFNVLRIHLPEMYTDFGKMRMTSIDRHVLALELMDVPLPNRDGHRSRYKYDGLYQADEISLAEVSLADAYQDITAMNRTVVKGYVNFCFILVY